MSSVTRGNKLPAVDAMVPYMDGTYQQETFSGWEWRCDGCGLVWDRRGQAESCESRQHVDHFTQSYGYKLPGFETHGRTGQNVYTRRALRRASQI